MRMASIREVCIQFGKQGLWTHEFIHGGAGYLSSLVLSCHSSLGLMVSIVGQEANLELHEDYEGTGRWDTNVLSHVA